MSDPVTQPAPPAQDPITAFFVDFGLPEWLLTSVISALLSAMILWVFRQLTHGRHARIKEDLSLADSRQEIVAELRRETTAAKSQQGYEKRLTWVLDWADRRIGAAWSGEAYGVSAALALFYPLALVLLIWIATGENHSGMDGFLSQTAPVWQRQTFISSLALGGFFMWRSFRTGVGQGNPLYGLGLGIFAIAIAIAIAVSGAGAGAVAGAGAGAVAVAGIVAGADAVVVAVVIAAAVTTAVASAVTTAVAGPFTAAGAGVGVGVAVGVGVGVGAVGRVIKQYKGRGYLALSILYSVVAFAAAALFAGEYNWQPGLSGAFIIFILFVPTVNAVFDWASISLTRGLLRRSLADGVSDRLRIGLGILDLGLALLLLIGLIVTLGFVIQAFNATAIAAGGDPQLKLTNLISGIAAEPFKVDYLWIHLMVFSTLLPTLVHVLTAALSFAAAWLPNAKTRREFADQIESGAYETNARIQRRIIRHLAWGSVMPACAFTLVVGIGLYGFAMLFFQLDWFALAGANAGEWVVQTLWR